MVSMEVLEHNLHHILMYFKLHSSCNSTVQGEQLQKVMQHPVKPASYFGVTQLGVDNITGSKLRTTG